MEFAVTLPQLGRASSGPSIKATARLAEELGYSDVWVNDHVAFPVGIEHPAPRMYDPLTTLTTAAAVTTRIGLGSQITASYYPPVFLAKVLASLDSLSDGRVKIAIGVGWAEGEFAAMGSDFKTRGKRTDEIIAILRACWENREVSFAGEYYDIPPIRFSPPPAQRIPIWIAGTTAPAFGRAVRLGDGYHGQPTRRDVDYDRQTSNSRLPELIRTLRRDRPDPADFTISMYTHDWDPAEIDADTIRRERDFFEEAGVQHVVAALSRTDGDAWMRSVDTLAQILMR